MAKNVLINEKKTFIHSLDTKRKPEFKNTINTYRKYK